MSNKPHRRSGHLKRIMERALLILISSLVLWSLLGTTSSLADEAKAPAPPGARNAAKIPEEAFTLIVLPDTQGYADTRHRETQKHWPDIGD